MELPVPSKETVGSWERIYSFVPKSLFSRFNLLHAVISTAVHLLFQADKMVLDDIRKVVLGQLPVDEFVSPLSASLMYLIITMLTGWLVRTVNRSVTPDPIRSYVADFSATLEMCAYFFENNFIFKNYGSLWLFIAVLVECFIANRTFYGASENPCHAFIQFLEKSIPASTAVLRIALQTLAGFASYRFAKVVWSLDMVPDHRDRYMETHCASDLNVALLTGFAIEMGATLVDTWLGRQTVARHSTLDEVIKLANGSLMIVIGEFC